MKLNGFQLLKTIQQQINFLIIKTTWLYIFIVFHVMVTSTCINLHFLNPQATSSTIHQRRCTNSKTVPSSLPGGKQQATLHDWTS